MTDAASCIFCRIVHGEAPSHRVYEDAHTLVIMDAFPVTDGHTLVLTKAHAATIFEASEADLIAVAAAARRVAHAIRAVLAPDGLMVFQLNGVAAMQTVFHYHMHLMPRRDGEGFALHTRVPGDPARLADLARQIAAAVS